MSDNRWSADRRSFIKAASAAGVTGLAGCSGDGGDDTPEGEDTPDDSTDESNGETTGETEGTSEATFILNPAEADVEIEEQYRPVFEYLESEIDVDITSRRTSSYTATLQAIRNDQGEIADISPSAVIAGEGVVDIIGMRIAFGAAQYFSTITTTPDSGIEELADVAGEEVYLGDILSVSGTLVPLTLFSRAGLDIGDAPDGEPVDFEVEYSDHTTAREQMVARDDVVAAGTGAFSSAPYVPQEQFEELSQDFVDVSAEYEGAGSALDDEDAQELKLLAVSDPLPRAPLVSRANWEDPVREEIEQALLDAPTEVFEHEEGYEGEELWFTGVESATMDDYQPIADVMEELGLEFEDLS